MTSPELTVKPRYRLMRELFAGFMATTLIVGCGDQGKPLVVSGVPAQVDYKDTRSESASWNPSLYEDNYYVGFEQCPADIAKIKSGAADIQPSFNPATRQYNPDCFDREYYVPKSTYDSYTEGQIVIFEGKLGSPVYRVG